MTQGRLFHAQSQLQKAERWLGRTPEVLFERARLARKFADDSTFVEMLKAAVNAGQNPERAQREAVFAEAQRGNLNALESQFADILISGQDADEACDAFVQGCMLKYLIEQVGDILDNWQIDYPQDPRPLIFRGRLLEHRINFDDAIEQFQKALKVDPGNPIAAYNLGRVLESQQRPEQALQAYQTAAETLGQPVPGLVGAARCLRLLQRPDEAAEILTRAEQASDRRDREAFRIVGDPLLGAETRVVEEGGYLAATMGDHQLAVSSLQQVVDADPNNWRARYQLGLSQRHTGQTEDAQRNLALVEETKEALATCDRLFDTLHEHPDDIAARLQIGRVFLQHLSENQGLIWLNGVLDLDPGNVEAHRTLAEYYRAHQNSHPEFRALAKRHEAYLPSEESNPE